MEAGCIYQIRIRADVRADEINPTSPVQVQVLDTSQDSTLFSACTDQSGLIGLLRHLHGLGFDLLSMESVKTGDKIRGLL